MAKISPSILNCDFLELDSQLKILEQNGTDMLHIDVMDGMFVPNISLGIPVIKSIKEHISLPLDVHLMIEKPERYIEDFAPLSDFINIHVEASDCVEDTIKRIRSLGCRPAITIKPNTKAEEIFKYLPLVDMVLVMSVEPGFGGQKFIPSALDKIRALRNEIASQNLDVEIEVDGGINDITARDCVNAGATVLVAGNYIFNAENPEENLKLLKSL